LSTIPENDFHRGLAALLGANIIAIIQLLTVEVNKLDKSLNLAIIAFSISIPCLSCIWNLERKIHSKDMPRICIAIGIIGVISSLFGLGACFDHFSGLASFLFITSTISVAVITLMVKNKYARPIKNLIENDKQPQG